MTSPEASALPLPGGSTRPRRRPREDASRLVAAHLEARRRRVQTIRRWVVALTVALFLTLQVVIFRSAALSAASTHASISSQRTSSGTASTRTSGSGTTSNSGSASSSSSVASASPSASAGAGGSSAISTGQS